MFFDNHASPFALRFFFSPLSSSSSWPNGWDGSVEKREKERKPVVMSPIALIPDWSVVPTGFTSLSVSFSLSLRLFFLDVSANYPFCSSLSRVNERQKKVVVRKKFHRAFSAVFRNISLLYSFLFSSVPFFFLINHHQSLSEQIHVFSFASVDQSFLRLSSFHHTRLWLLPKSNLANVNRF